MKILFAGKSAFDYNRVQVLLSGLEKNSSVELKKFSIQKRDVATRRSLQSLCEWADFIYIPPFRHRDVSYLRKITSKPIVFDPLISKYSTKVEDYNQPWKGPLKYFADKIPFSKADILIADTAAHKAYFAEKFRIPTERIAVLEVGVNTEAFSHNDFEAEKTDRFVIGFYGSFVPLQGVDQIIETAALLQGEKDIVFDITGTGHDYPAAVNKATAYGLKNIAFRGWSDYDKLSAVIAGYDIALGIFGHSAKADRVIPNKLFHYAAMGKCTITKDSKAVREIFTDQQNIVLCNNDPAAIAAAILALRSDRKTITRIGKAAAQLIRTDYNEDATARKFLAILDAYRPT